MKKNIDVSNLMPDDPSNVNVTMETRDVEIELGTRLGLNHVRIDGVELFVYSVKVDAAMGRLPLVTIGFRAKKVTVIEYDEEQPLHGPKGNIVRTIEFDDPRMQKLAHGIPDITIRRKASDEESKEEGVQEDGGD